MHEKSLKRSINFSPETLKTLDTLAAKNSTTTSELVRQFVEKGLSVEGYQSELVRVAEDIYTPAPVGQYQHGSARWLRDTEKRKVFGTQVISPQNELIRELLDTGYSDLPFMQKKKDVQADTGQSTAVQDETAGLPPVAIEKQEEKEGLVQDEDFETVDYDLAAAGFTQPPQETPDSASAEQESNEKEADPYQLFPEGGIVVGMDRIGGKELGESPERLYYISEDTHMFSYLKTYELLKLYFEKSCS